MKVSRKNFSDHLLKPVDIDPVFKKETTKHISLWKDLNCFCDGSVHIFIVSTSCSTLLRIWDPRLMHNAVSRVWKNHGSENPVLSMRFCLALCLLIFTSVPLWVSGMIPVPPTDVYFHTLREKISHRQRCGKPFTRKICMGNKISNCLSFLLDLLFSFLFRDSSLWTSLLSWKKDYNWMKKVPAKNWISWEVPFTSSI